ncbi:1-aminocyclopropane-1-carboxylate synthase-like protein 1-like [Homarus americanus]|uniref:1-aminocyclopropane-1-carboxylate synthase-like protein 1-like n=1 Tax=Homarus americanus TaxID=6706 RepID=A0A8J5JN87_HOMAM|nr:1-aminocyclopropane-1-carboxylate synthase-like protein 1-like [Homarus americanus]
MSSRNLITRYIKGFLPAERRKRDILHHISQNRLPLQHHKSVDFRPQASSQAAVLGLVTMSLLTSEGKQKAGKLLLSSRGAKTASFRDFLYESFLSIEDNLYGADSNPQGIVNMSTSISCLMEDEITSRLMQGDAFNVLSLHHHYFTFSGTGEAKISLTDFLNRHFHPVKPILPNNIIIANGVTSCLDALGHVLCDPGDVNITPTPVYSHIVTEFRDVADVCIEPLVLSQEENSEGMKFSLSAEALEDRILELQEGGRRNISSLIYGNINSLTFSLISRHELHFICDEIYALSVYGENAVFQSVLTLDLPDPRRTHVLWALIWCDEFYLPTYKKRITGSYLFARRRLEEMGVTVKTSQAGLFLWFSVQPFLCHPTEEEEMSKTVYYMLTKHTRGYN